MEYTKTKQQIFISLSVPTNEFKGVAISEAVNEIAIVDPSLNNLLVTSINVEGFANYNESNYTVICQILTPVTDAKK
jgi:hypothetical protein